MVDINKYLDGNEVYLEEKDLQLIPTFSDLSGFFNWHTGSGILPVTGNYVFHQPQIWST